MFNQNKDCYGSKEYSFPLNIHAYLKPYWMASGIFID